MNPPPSDAGYESILPDSSSQVYRHAPSVVSDRHAPSVVSDRHAPSVVSDRHAPSVVSDRHAPSVASMAVDRILGNVMARRPLTASRLSTPSSSRHPSLSSDRQSSHTSNNHPSHSVSMRPPHSASRSSVIDHQTAPLHHTGSPAPSTISYDMTDRSSSDAKRSRVDESFVGTQMHTRDTRSEPHNTTPSEITAKLFARSMSSRRSASGASAISASAVRPSDASDAVFMGSEACAVPNSSEFSYEFATHQGMSIDDTGIVAGDIDLFAFNGGVSFFVAGLRLSHVSSRDDLLDEIDGDRKLSASAALEKITRIQVPRLEPKSKAAEYIDAIVAKKGCFLVDDHMDRLLTKTEGALGTVQIERSLRSPVYFVFSGRFYELRGVYVPNTKFMNAYDSIVKTYADLKDNSSIQDDVDLHMYLAYCIRLKEFENLSSININRDNYTNAKTSVKAYLNYMAEYFRKRE